MKLDLSEIATHLGKHIKYQMDEPPFVDEESGLEVVSPIKGSLVLTNTGSLIVVRGDFQCVIALECSRCLRSYAMDIDLPVEEGLSIAPHLIPEIVEEGEERELPEDEKEPLFENNLFDLTELIRQSILVSLPIKTLCESDCKGLCLKCGKNLNEGPCKCPADQEDSPFSALSALLEKHKEDK